jgi:hypothetical protein
MRSIIRHLEYINRAHKDDLLKQLIGQVFHLTTKQAFEQIKSEGFVFHNQSQRFNINTGSENSSGRKRGWVCLFDLRNKSGEDIGETLIRYNFLGPEWFRVSNKEFSELNLTYLILDSSFYEKIVPNEEVKEWIKKKQSEFYIPRTECWYPGDMPLACIHEAIVVKIFQDVPKDNSIS